ncbi:hypothetical protein Cgig2_015548 [Carnegiea gigantea]|uniref:Uncharacterized protein n=1 Tax=Carnegiea gigantea TaxID=171969 RepID=A0A9Q1GLF8_9CARY|nr:hypothetical protein Cgig2_015548 [Carnegiea gigantea]
MSTGLEEVWENLTLTEEEEKVLIVDDDEDTANDEQITLCLLGRLYIDLSFNARAMKTVMRNVWQPLLYFFNPSDKKYVLNEGPSACDDHLLLLKQMTGLEIPSEVVFTTAHFWVKAYKVLGKKQISSFAKVLASNIDELARARLVLDNPTFVKQNEAPLTKSDNTSPAHMITEPGEILEMGAEAFKRKQSDIPFLKATDCKIRIIKKNSDAPSSLNILVEKWKTWELINDLSTQSTLPWLGGKHQ